MSNKSQIYIYLSTTNSKQLDKYSEANFYLKFNSEKPIPLEKTENKNVFTAQINRSFSLIRSYTIGINEEKKEEIITEVFISDVENKLNILFHSLSSSDQSDLKLQTTKYPIKRIEVQFHHFIEPQTPIELLQKFNSFCLHVKNKCFSESLFNLMKTQMHSQNQNWIIARWEIIRDQFEDFNQYSEIIFQNLIKKVPSISSINQREIINKYLTCFSFKDWLQIAEKFKDFSLCIIEMLTEKFSDSIKQSKVKHETLRKLICRINNNQANALKKLFFSHNIQSFCQYNHLPQSNNDQMYSILNNFNLYSNYCDKNLISQLFRRIHSSSVFVNWLINSRNSFQKQFIEMYDDYYFFSLDFKLQNDLFTFAIRNKVFLKIDICSFFFKLVSNVSSNSSEISYNNIFVTIIQNYPKSSWISPLNELFCRYLSQTNYDNISQLLKLESQLISLVKHQKIGNSYNKDDGIDNYDDFDMSQIERFEYHFKQKLQEIHSSSLIQQFQKKKINEIQFLRSFEMKIEMEAESDNQQFIENCKKLSSLYESGGLRYEKITQLAISKCQNYIITQFNLLKESNQHLNDNNVYERVNQLPQFKEYHTLVRNSVEEVLDSLAQKSIEELNDPLFKSSLPLKLIQFFKMNIQIDEIYESIRSVKEGLARFNTFQNRFKDIQGLMKIEINILFKDIKSIQDQIQEFSQLSEEYFYLEKSEIFNELLVAFEEEFEKENPLDINNLKVLFECVRCTINIILTLLLDSPSIQTNLDDLPDEISIKVKSLYFQEGEEMSYQIFQQITEGAIDSSKKRIQNLINQINNYEQSAKKPLNMRDHLAFIQLSKIQKENILQQIDRLDEYVFFATKSALIKKIFDYFHLDTNLEENKQFLANINAISEVDYLSFSPTRILNDFRVNFFRLYKAPQQKDILIQYSQLANGLDLVVNLEIILNELEKNESINFNDFHDFVDDGEEGLNTLLISLSKHANTFKDIIRLRKLQLDSKVGTSTFRDLVVVLRKQVGQLFQESVIENLSKQVEGFHKFITLCEKTMKKKEYLRKVAIEIVTHGQFIFKLKKEESSESKGRSPEIVLDILAQNKPYQPSTLSEIYARVFVPKQEYNSNEPEDQNFTRIRLLKSQWICVQSILTILSKHVSYGNIGILQSDICFQNNEERKDQEEVLNSMRLASVKYVESLESWRQNIRLLLQQFPILSNFGFNQIPTLFEYFGGQPIKQFDDIFNFLGLSSVIQNKPDTLINGTMDEIEKLRKIGEFLSIEQSNQNQIIQGKSNPNELPPLKYQLKQVPRISIVSVKQQNDAIKFISTEFQSLWCQPKYNQFFLFGKHSKLLDLELFLMRFEFLNAQHPLNFYLILSGSLIDQAFIKGANIIISELASRMEQLRNTLYIFQNENMNYLSEVPLLKPTKITDIQIEKYNGEQNKSNEPCVEFFYSQKPGAGKTFMINSRMKDSKKTIRIPTYFGEKHTFINTIKQRIIDVGGELEFVHIDLYQNNELDIELILFEMFYLNSLSTHESNLVFFNKNVTFLVEISNTALNGLFNSLSIKEKFPVTEIAFDLSMYSVSQMERNSEKELNAIACYQYLKAIQEKGLESENLVIEIPITEEDILEFHELLKVYFLAKYNEFPLSSPCFYQLSHFINLFGSEMRKFNQCIYLEKSLLENPLKVCQKVRTTVVEMSYEFTVQLSVFRQKQRKQQRIVDPNLMNVEEYLEGKSESIENVKELMQNFVTFQEQQVPSLTLFVKNENQHQTPILREYYQHFGRQDIGVMNDSHNIDPKIIRQWFMFLVNQHGESALNRIDEKITFQRDSFFKGAIIFMRIRALCSSILQVLYFFLIL